MNLCRRLGSLSVLFAFELIALSIWLDTAALSSQHGLAAWVGNWGPLLVRFAIVFAVAVLTLSWTRSKNAAYSLSKELVNIPLSVPALTGHLGIMGVFALLSALLFSGRISGFREEWTAVAWLLAGAAAVILAGIAVLPAGFWMRLIRLNAEVLSYAAAAAAVVCLAPVFDTALWKPSTQLTFRLVTFLVRPFIPGLMVDPKTMLIGSSNFSVTVNPECSGIEGMALMLAFGLAWLGLFRHEYRFPHAFVLLPTGICVLWVLNSFRIAALILIGNAGATAIAMGGFHSQAGWIAFNVVAVSFSIASGRISCIRRQPRVEARQPYPAAPYLAPFLALMATAMIGQALSNNSFEWLYPLRFLAAATALWFFRETYSGLNWRGGWLAVGGGAAVFVLWVVLERLGGGTVASGIPAGLQSMTRAGQIGWLSVRALAAVTTVPIVEELAFRGFLIRRLISADFELLDPRRHTLIAVLVSSLAFGLLHGHRWLAGTLTGLLYAAIFLRRGRIGDSVLAHATTNALLAIWVLWRGEWGLW